ncbi:MAG: MotA/TolQ/ExbB proton channel family protein [Planctomycetota bacterium]|nr:MotA/TolQ/ExbB proton channel family protein [Planctomycetota bacterium]
MKKWTTVLCVLLVVMLLASTAMAQDGKPKGKQISWLEWFVTGTEWVAWVLMVLSFVSTALIIQMFMQIRRPLIMPPHVELQVKQMLEAKQFRELLAFTQGDPSLLSIIMNRALREAPNGYGAMEHEMETALQEQSTKLNLKPEILSILGNTGPLIGLLGTVLGIIKAFAEIVKVGSIPNPGDLAGSIGMALVATFWGLTVAIPSLVVYSIIKNRIELYTNEAVCIGRECLAGLRLGPKARSKSRDGVEAEANVSA